MSHCNLAVTTTYVQGISQSAVTEGEIRADERWQIGVVLRALGHTEGVGAIERAFRDVEAA